MTRHLLVALVLAALAVAVVACGDEPEVRAEPTPIPVSDECRQAFRDVVAVTEDTTDDGDEDEAVRDSGVGAGSLSDLRPTLDACATTTEWFEAYRATWTERTEGISPTAALRTLCDRGPDGEARDTAVCRQIVVDGPEGQPGEE